MEIIFMCLVFRIKYKELCYIKLLYLELMISSSITHSATGEFWFLVFFNMVASTIQNSSAAAAKPWISILGIKEVVVARKIHILAATATEIGILVVKK